MKVLRAGRKVIAVVEDDSSDVMCIWTTGLIHTYQGVTEPKPEEIVPGFMFDNSVGKAYPESDRGYGLEFETLKTIPIGMPKAEVVELFGLTFTELQRLQREEWVE